MSIASQPHRTQCTSQWAGLWWCLMTAGEPRHLGGGAGGAQTRYECASQQCKCLIRPTAADPRSLEAQGCTTFCVLSAFAEWRNVLWAVFCRQLSIAGKTTSNTRLSASLYRHEGKRCQKFILHARCYWPSYFIDLIHRLNNCHLNEHVTKINVPSCGSVYKLIIDLGGEEKNFKSTMWKENMHKEKELLRPTYCIWILLNDSNTMWRYVRLHSQERHMYRFTMSPNWTCMHFWKQAFFVHLILVPHSETFPKTPLLFKEGVTHWTLGFTPESACLRFQPSLSLIKAVSIFFSLWML